MRRGQERLRTVEAVAVIAVVALVALVAWARTRTPGGTAATSFPKFRAARVGAASDLRFALTEIAAGYASAHPDIEPPQITYGSSGTLFAQIENGAPFDLFLSADASYPTRLVGEGHGEADTLAEYASGSLAVWLPADSPLDLDTRGLAAVADERVAHVAIANPAHAPYGAAAEAALRAAAVYEAVKPRLVLGENVGQALQFAQSGAADLAVVALSLARASGADKPGRVWTVPSRLYAPIQQWGVVLRTERSDQARDFQRYLRSSSAQAVLDRYGFGPPGAAKPEVKTREEH
jgi:molybdate transport system substrate-binding protein